MRVYMDPDLAMWVRLIVERVQRKPSKTSADARFTAELLASIGTDHNGVFVELPDDPGNRELTLWFVGFLIFHGMGKSFGRSFASLAAKIAAQLDVSVIDRLAEIVNPRVDPVPFGHRRRDRAREHLKRRGR
jgi:hypothetical protein